MKRISLMLALALMVTLGFAQKKDRTSAYNYLRSGKLNKAVEYIEKTITHESTMNEAKTWSYRGDIYLQVAITDDADYKALSDNPLQVSYDSYKKALSLPDSKEFIADIMTNMNVIAESYFNKGVAAYNAKDYKASMNGFLTASGVKEDIGVTDTSALLNAGAAADLAEMPQESAKIYQKLIDFGYSTPSIYALSSASFLNSGDTIRAASVVAKGRELFPADYSLLIAETNLFLAVGKSQEAFNNLKVAIEKDPTNASILFVLGTQYDNKGNVAEAEKAYKRALEIRPDYFDAIYNLGALYVNDAARLMSVANSIPPDKIKEYDAKKAEADGSLEKALPYLEQAHEMDPNDRNTIVTLKEIYARKSNFEKVKEMDSKLK